MWPEARSLLSSYTVLRWEMNLGFYNRLSTLILLIYALVLASDWIVERLRLKVA